MNDNAQEVADRCKSAKRYIGGFLISCPNPAHPDRKPSCMVSDGPNGVVFHCLSGCDWRDVRAGAELQGLIQAWSSSKSADIVFTAPKKPVRRSQATEDIAQKLISKSTPAVMSGAVTAYWQRRGLELPIPHAIRSCLAWCRETESEQRAMLSIVDHCDGRQTVHLTYLKTEGNKLNVTPNKIILGSSNGGAVRLAEATDQLALAEGIESAASFQQLTGIATWACLSTAGLKGVELPALPLASQVIIAADNDEPGRKAANSAAERFTQMGRETRIVLPPNPGDDWNDVLLGEAA